MTVFFFIFFFVTNLCTPYLSIEEETFSTNPITLSKPKENKKDFKLFIYFFFVVVLKALRSSLTSKLFYISSVIFIETCDINKTSHKNTNN